MYLFTTDENLEQQVTQLKSLILEKNDFFDWALFCEAYNYQLGGDKNTISKTQTTHQLQPNIKGMFYSSLLNSTGSERIVAEFLEEVGLNVVPLSKVDYKEALQILTLILQNDLAYSGWLMDLESAEILAVWFLDFFVPHGQYFTNTRNFVNRLSFNSYSSNEVTDATFDVAVIGVNDTRVGILCVKAED